MDTGASHVGGDWKRGTRIGEASNPGPVIGGERGGRGRPPSYAQIVSGELEWRGFQNRSLLYGVGGAWRKGQETSKDCWFGERCKFRCCPFRHPNSLVVGKELMKVGSVRKVLKKGNGPHPDASVRGHGPSPSSGFARPDRAGRGENYPDVRGTRPGDMPAGSTCRASKGGWQGVQTAMPRTKTRRAICWFGEKCQYQFCPFWHEADAQSVRNRIIRERAPRPISLRKPMAKDDNYWQTLSPQPRQQQQQQQQQQRQHKQWTHRAEWVTPLRSWRVGDARSRCRWSDEGDSCGGQPTQLQLPASTTARQQQRQQQRQCQLGGRHGKVGKGNGAGVPYGQRGYRDLGSRSTSTSRSPIRQSK